MTKVALISAAATLCALGFSMSPAERRAGRFLRNPDGHDAPKTPAELAASLKKDFEKKFDEVKEKAEQAVADAKKGHDQTEKQKEIIDDLLLKMNETKSQLDDMAQKMAADSHYGRSGEDRQKSIGEQFIESEGFKAFQASNFSKSVGRADLQIKATLTSATTDTAGAVGDAVVRTRLPGLIPLPQRRMTIRDLLSPGTMDGNTIEYVKETGFNNNAAPVAEAAAKPESDIKLDLISTTAKVIAHNMKASRQILSDVSQLKSTIDQRLLYGLEYKLEGQLLNGDGTGQNLLGIVPQATAYSAPITIAGATSIDQMRLAMLQAALAELPATGHVMNPIDWTAIELMKDEQGRYIIGLPQGTATPTLWGLPVVQTQSMAVDKFLTGAFSMAAQYFERWESRVETGYVNDDFTKNLVTILAELRGALAVYRPEAFIYGDFGRVT